MRQAGWQLVGVVVLTVCAGLVAELSAQYPGFLIPEGGKTEKSPVTAPADAARRGKVLFLAHCARCHGPEGKGNGPDSDHAADLTDDLRIELNTEGVLFYKIWNGHAIQLRTQVDDMPAFKDKLTRYPGLGHRRAPEGSSDTSQVVSSLTPSDSARLLRALLESNRGEVHATRKS